MSKKAIIRVEENPGLSDPGPRPVLQWIKKDRFVVDMHYQRSIKSRASQANIQHITANFAWTKFSPPTVTPAGDSGKFIVVDGQHRIEAVRQRPDLPELPCYVLGDLTQNEQARIFVAVNADRVALTQYALYHAKCAAGDRMALKIKEVCEEADITICRTPVPGGMTAPRETQALGTIKRGIEVVGEENVIAALMIIPETYRFAPGMMRSRIIAALMQFFYNRGIKKVDREALKRVLAKQDPITRECEARAKAHVNKTKRGDELLKRLNDDYEEELVPSKPTALKVRAFA